MRCIWCEAPALEVYQGNSVCDVHKQEAWLKMVNEQDRKKDQDVKEDD